VTIETLFGAKHTPEPQPKPIVAPGPAGAQENA